MKRAPLSRGAYKCLKYIKSYDFQKRGWSCPNHKTLSEDLDVTPRQIKRYIAELSGKYYLISKRRPNTSSLYYFGADKLKNVPTKGTENVPADVPADVPTIQLVLKHRNAQETTMQMPDFLTTPSEQKLWRMAQRWISANKPPLITALDVGPIMMQLEGAGALDLAEDAPLPKITWPGLEALPLSKPAIQRKPMGIAESDLAALSRKVSGS